MPAPATVTELLDLVQKSGVADEAKLKAYLAGPVNFPPEPSKAAGLLVRDGLLTYFQAEQLLQGKWKRFSIGKYKVLEKLGSGGMGQVFLCEHKLMRRRVAVKVLPTAKAADEASLGRFYREARAVAALDHPNIVRAYDIDQDENLHFLVMEYVDGTNFQDLVKKIGPLDVVRACHYISGASVGLQHAHEIGLIHRDIKPGNILLDRSGIVKILDMGLARFFHNDDDNITRQYDENILGTADYLSPEQAEDSHTVDIRTDIYSLGATFYYLLTGSQPFPDGTIPQKLIWHRTREPKSIKAIRPDVPDEIVAIVNRMMAKKPADRFQTPADVMAALAPWMATPIPPPSDREMPQLSPAVQGNAGRNQGLNATRAVSVPHQLLSGGSTGSGLHTSPTPSAAGAPTLNGGTTAAVPPLPALPPRLPAAPLVPGAANQAAPPAAGGVWESLDDLPPLEPDDTGRRMRSSDPKSGSGRHAAMHVKSKLVPLVLAGVGLLVLVGAGVGVYLAFFRAKPIDTPPVATGPKRLIVSRAKAGAENTFPTLAEAVRKAAPGDTVAIEDPQVAEPAIRLSRTRDVTIESGLPDGKPAVIEFSAPGGGAGVSALFELSNCDSVKLKNLELDGKGDADHGVVVGGTAPGITLEAVTVRGVRKCGFHLLNVAGLQGRPVVLDHVRAVLSATDEAGVKVEARQKLTSRGLVIRNSRFEGSGRGAGVRFEGLASDVEVVNCRLYKLDEAVSIGRGPDGSPIRLQINQNTIFDTRYGLHVMPPGKGGGPGTFEITANRNYFAKVSQGIAQADGGPVTTLKAIDNGSDPDAKSGSLPLVTTKIDAPRLTPSPNPADDANFLRFPPGAGPVVGGAKVRVGAE